MPQIQDEVRKTMLAVGRSVDRFNPTQATVATGEQLSLLAKKIQGISLSAISQAEREELAQLAELLRVWGARFENAMHMGAVGLSDHGRLLTLDFGLAWTSLASMHSVAKFPLAAIAEGVAMWPSKTVGMSMTEFVDPEARD